MLDKQTVIKALEICAVGTNSCFKCPLKDNCKGTSNAAMVAAIELLKEQEDLGAELTNAIELVHKKNERIMELLKEQEPRAVGLYGKDDWYRLVCFCPDCNAEWMSSKEETHFCPNCGRALKWE